MLAENIMTIDAIRTGAATLNVELSAQVKANDYVILLFSPLIICCGPTRDQVPPSSVRLTQLIRAIWGAPVSVFVTLQSPYWGLEMWNFAASSSTPPAAREGD